MVNSNGEVKITDFGVSGHVINTIGMAETFLGTSCYMSPERIKGDPHSPSSDCWSLGLSVMELALGYFPYLNPGQQKPLMPGQKSKSSDRKDGLKFWQLWDSICNEEAPQLSTEQGFSDDMCAFVAECLEKDPDKRKSSEELLQHPWIIRARQEEDTGLIGKYVSRILDM